MFKIMSPRIAQDMKHLAVLLSVFIVFVSCSKEPTAVLSAANYEFITEYTTNITVGGIVGVAQRTFNVGEVYSGSDEVNANITLRITAHTKNNENCPNPWCYQEFLEVPRIFLQPIP